MGTHGRHRESRKKIRKNSRNTERKERQATFRLIDQIPEYVLGRAKELTNRALAEAGLVVNEDAISISRAGNSSHYDHEYLKTAAALLVKRGACPDYGQFVSSIA